MFFPNFPWTREGSPKLEIMFTVIWKVGRRFLLKWTYYLHNSHHRKMGIITERRWQFVQPLIQIGSGSKADDLKRLSLNVTLCVYIVQRGRKANGRLFRVYIPSESFIIQPFWQHMACRFGKCMGGPYCCQDPCPLGFHSSFLPPLSTFYRRRKGGKSSLVFSQLVGTEQDNRTNSLSSCFFFSSWTVSFHSFSSKKELS